MTAEKFLREKLESEIASFGDGTTEFHTRDLQHLLQCLYEKDKRISTNIEFAKQEAIEFATWYSGMDEIKVIVAYERFQKERMK